MSTRVLTAHVPQELAEQVDAVAERLERSRGWVVKQALSAWIDQEEERHRLTLEAMADVRAGNFVEQQEIDDWLAGLED